MMRHKWAASKFAESATTGDVFPVGWTCTQCGLFKRMGIRRIDYYETKDGVRLGSHAGRCSDADVQSIPHSAAERATSRGLQGIFKGSSRVVQRRSAAAEKETAA